MLATTTTPVYEPSTSYLPANFPRPFGKMRREDMVNCSACWRPKSKVALKRCGNCMVALYCGEQCQREHWDSHKVQCKLTEDQWKSCEKDMNLSRMNKELFKWTAKHHPTLTRTVIDALDIYNQPRVVDEELVLIFLSHEPETSKMEKRFRVLSAGRATYGAILKFSSNPLLEELPKQRRLMEEDHRKKNRNIGVAFCLLVCTGEDPSSSLHRVVPITFQKELTPSEKEAVQQGKNANWLWFLVDVTDKGIIF